MIDQILDNTVQDINITDITFLKDIPQYNRVIQICQKDPGFLF